MNTTALIDIGKRIKEQCPAIKHIDIFNNQYLPDMQGKTMPFNRPAVFLEFGNTDWDNTSDGVQQGEGLLRVHVVMEVYKDTYKIFDKTDVQQAALLEHYNRPREVHNALQGYQAEGTASPLERVSSIPDHDYDMLIIEIFEYHFRDVDCSAEPEYTNAVIRHVRPGNTIQKS